MYSPHQNSPTFPLYSEIMCKGKPKAGERNWSQPEVTKKQLTEKELNLLTDEGVPTIPQQDLTTQDTEQMAPSIEVLMSACQLPYHESQICCNN